jgi:hypothetical protein
VVTRICVDKSKERLYCSYQWGLLYVHLKKSITTGDNVRFEFESNIQIQIFDILNSLNIEFESNMYLRT